MGMWPDARWIDQPVQWIVPTVLAVLFYTVYNTLLYIIIIYINNDMVERKTKVIFICIRGTNIITSLTRRLEVRGLVCHITNILLQANRPRRPAYYQDTMR